MLENSRITPIEPAKVLACAASGITEMIAHHNGDVDTIFGRATINKTDVQNPQNEINLQQYCRLFEEAAKQTGNDNFGLHFGQQFAPKQLGAIGYAAVSAPTLAAAIQNITGYFPAHQEQSSFGVFQDNDILWLNYRITDPRITCKRQDAELSLGMFVNIFRLALGKYWAPLEVCFEHNRPDNAEEHSQMFGALTRFGRRTNAFAFRRQDLDALMPEHDPFLFSVIEPILKSRCQVQENPQDFATVVRDQIKMLLGENTPGPSEIAKLLSLTDHKFHKKMKDKGISFNSILRAARQELATHYLKNPDIPLTEVALCLGYSEQSAFSRAFRNWTGMSPRHYRQTSRE
ncbi:MAG: AraC family transcriptional regulator [Alphaproteobacteria bacterium]|nr:MAG: AraC family transcriptional regulator [Alphaproteobacteria bacterium]